MYCTHYTLNVQSNHYSVVRIAWVDALRSDQGAAKTDGPQVNIYDQLTRIFCVYVQ